MHVVGTFAAVVARSAEQLRGGGACDAGNGRAAAAKTEEGDVRKALKVLRHGHAGHTPGFVTVPLHRAFLIT